MDESQAFHKEFTTSYLREYVHTYGEKCWLCERGIKAEKTPLNEWTITMNMHKKLSSKKVSPIKRVKTWKEMMVFIPACKSCKRRFLGYQIVGFIIGSFPPLATLLAILTRHDYLLVITVPLIILYPLYTQLMLWLYTNFIQLGLKRKLASFFIVRQLHTEGWQYGNQIG